VFTDFRDWLDYGEPEQVVLREWEADLSLEYEFRAFVHNGKVTVISQYDHYCVYPSLPKLKDKLQDMMLKLWQEVHPHVGEDSYVMDFAYLPSKDQMKVIEISPFLDCTGAALFRWSNDRYTDML
jgi:hypothetical protein